jgi:glucosamine 6-phosphate synthetase-like amidotransferase/phosphosugar isomerase protein
LIGVELDQGASIKDAVKNVVETKLMGTWKMVVMATDKPDRIYFVKNSGDFILGKTDNSVVVTSEDILFEDKQFVG